ncbi:MAG: hypothetical protein QXL76_00025 [Candidatus Rehaiarchaeum fermentans]|nr:hypothetical protein [Candidatus Rehaiarchaeum fermentans]
MNGSFLINYLIFSAFLLLVLYDNSVVIYSILNYKKYKEKIKKYFLPIWEVLGTFGVFYVVNTEATFPLAIPLISSVFIIPILIAGLLFLLRNYFFSNFENKSSEESKYLFIITSLILWFLVFSLLANVSNGYGINLLTKSINWFRWFTNPLLYVLLIVGFVSSLFIGNIIFSEKKNLILFILYILIFSSLLAFLRFNYNFFTINLYLIYAYAAIILLFLLFIFMKSKFVTLISLILVFLSIFVVSSSFYPYILGGLNMIEFLGNSQISYYVFLITLIGGIFISVSILYLVLSTMKY